MAIKTAREAFLEAVQAFPKWMSIRKRPYKSNMGKLLQAVFEEYKSIQAELDDFVRDFFLLSYVGREQEIPDYIYIMHIGDPFGQISLTKPSLKVTTAPKLFMKKPKEYALLQDGYIMIHTEMLPVNQVGLYSVDEYAYSGKFERFHVWNVIDEFAMFLGLERFTDETNSELLKRCFLVFKNPTNSTTKGIYNAIANAMSNDIPLREDDIRIEPLTQENIILPDEEFGTVYERLAQVNHDIFRTKRWDMDSWENTFKTLDFIPHIWDKEISVFRDGVGQNDDLKVFLSNSMKYDSTNVYATGYKIDSFRINEYVRQHNIHKEIPLKLERYNDELKSKIVEYKITAYPATKIDKPQNIYLKEQAVIDGKNKYFLDDIIYNASKSKITIKPHNKLDKNAKYEARFIPRSKYSDMTIEKANIIHANGKVESLLCDKGNFRAQNGSFHNVDVVRHIDSIKQLKDYKNIVGVENGGFTIGGQSTIGDLYVDVSKCGNKPLYIGVTGDRFDISGEDHFFQLDGFSRVGDGTFRADSANDAACAMTVEIDCCSFEFSMGATSEQGSASVQIIVDGKSQAESGIWNSERRYVGDYDKTVHVKVIIRRMGVYPVFFHNFRAARYSYSYELDHGQFMHTPYGILMPSMEDGEKYTLHVHMETRDVEAPTLNYIHIGSPTTPENSTYKTEIFSVNEDGATIDLGATCRIELWKDGMRLYDNFTPKASYKNETDETLYLLINTDQFIEIKDSSRKIVNTTDSAGRSAKAIQVLRGEELDSILIQGRSYQIRSRMSLDKLLDLEADEDVYVSNAMPGFIIHNRKTGVEYCKFIQREHLSDATVFTYENLPEGLTGCYRVDSARDVVVKNNNMTRMFEDTYAAPKNESFYTAYNRATMKEAQLDNIEIVNTFMPMLDMSLNMVYVIEPGQNSAIQATEKFVKFNKAGDLQFENWSLNTRSIHIEASFNYANLQNYAVSVSTLSEYFAISNEIVLEKSYKVGDEKYELAQYIIEPPQGMYIDYNVDDYTESACISMSGFNKLFYSNIVTVAQILTETGKNLTEDDYEVLDKEGIIVWKNQNIIGQNILIVYTFKRPRCLKYKDLSSLYKIVGYDVNAYSAINKTPVLVRDLSNGASHTIRFLDESEHEQTPDKVVLNCTNPNYSARYSDGQIVATKTNKDNVAILNAGYYYDDGQEYYLFNSEDNEQIDKLGDVKLNDVIRIGTDFKMIERSSNFLRDSAMNGKDRYPLCSVDFTNDDIAADGLSANGPLTACDTYNAWTDFGMNIAFTKALNGLGIHFTPEHSNAYALTDISRFVQKGWVVSFSATAGLETYLMQEILADKDSMRKSVFVQTLAEFEAQDIYRTLIFNEDMDKTTRYYIMVQGSGTLDDIVAKPYLGESVEQLHRKNVDAIGFKIEEKEPAGTLRYLGFDKEGATLDKVEIRKDGLLRTSTTLDWGVTQVYSIKGHEEEFKLNNVELTKRAFYTNDRSGRITSPRIYIPNHKAALTVYVKVNDVMLPALENFNIKAYISGSEDSALSDVGVQQETNLAVYNGAAMDRYLQIVVEMPRHKVINDLEVFVRYGQTSKALVQASINQNGEFTSKVYDMTKAASYRFSALEGKVKDLGGMRLYIRGCRQDNGHEVWTEWYPCILDDELKANDQQHIFEDYRLFQFKVAVDTAQEEIKIDNYVLEVV